MKRNFAHPFFAQRRPLVFGHRGASGELPENTLASFRRALEQGADVLETDVHLSRDGRVVVAHDAGLARMTDGRGALEALSFTELRALDAGHGFTSDGGASFPERGRGHRIPLLAEVFEAFPGARLNIELKSDAPELAHAVLKLVREARREALTLLAAGEDRAMTRLRAAVAEQQSEVALGASLSEIVAFVKAAVAADEAGRAHSPLPEPRKSPPGRRPVAGARANAPAKQQPPADARADAPSEQQPRTGARDPALTPEVSGVMALQVPPEFAGAPLVTPAFIAHAHAHGVQVHVWTLNEPRELARLLALGVDGVMSDYPARAVRARAELEARAAAASS